MSQGALSVFDYVPQDAVQTDPIRLDSIIKDNATALKAVDVALATKIIKTGKSFGEGLVNMRKKLERERALADTEHFDDKKYTHVTYLGFELRVLGDAGQNDITKKRFFAILHRKIHESTASVVSPLVETIILPPALKASKNLDLVGTGMEYNHALFDSVPEMWYFAYLLDYLAYMRPRKNKGEEYESMGRFFSDKNNHHMSTAIGLVRQGATVMKKDDKDQVEVWLEETSTTGGKMIYKRLTEAAGIFQMRKDRST